MMKHIVLFTFGGILYLLTELLWRGFSHWSMFFLGGVCFLAVGLINERTRESIPLLLRMTISSVIITALEFAVGWVVNVKLGLGIWDYSNMSCNIMGQVCLMYTAMWFVLSLGCILLNNWLCCYLFGEERVRDSVVWKENR